MPPLVGGRYARMREVDFTSGAQVVCPPLALLRRARSPSSRVPSRKCACTPARRLWIDPGDARCANPDPWDARPRAGLVRDQACSAGGTLLPSLAHFRRGAMDTSVARDRWFQAVGRTAIVSGSARGCAACSLVRRSRDLSRQRPSTERVSSRSPRRRGSSRMARRGRAVRRARWGSGEGLQFAAGALPSRACVRRAG